MTTVSGQTSIQPATRLVGRYELRERVGTGAMAEVFLADDLRYDRPVAIKIARAEISDHVDHERFAREILTASRLAHPGIVPVFDSGAYEGRPFYVMPFVAGETLGARLRSVGPVSVADAVPILSDIAGALDYAHAHGVIHRDLKPDNILLTEGRALLGDFGIALVVKRDARITLDGTGIGTPAYMSPEQFDGTSVDARTDIYSLGCVAYEMLSGTIPFQADRAAVWQYKHVVQAPPPLSDHGLQQLSPVVQRAMAKDPAQRYESATEFVRAMTCALTPVVTPPTGPAPRPSANSPLGREEDVVEVARLIEDNQVVTLLGPGGIGKSTLAYATLDRIRPLFPDGCFVVAAGRTAGDYGILAGVAGAIGVAAAVSSDQVGQWLAGRRVLLLIDGIEEIPSDIGMLIELLDDAPAARVLATSRRSLGFASEVVFEVRGLRLEAATALLGRLIHRYTRHPLRSDETSDAAAICGALEGTPLALHHVAHLRRVMSLTRLREQINRDPGVLEARLVGVPDRHRSIRGIFEQSLALLSPEHQGVLCRLGVFPADFDFDAAAAVAHADVESMRALVDGSFLTLNDNGTYHLHSVHRHFAMQRLEREGTLVSVELAHTEYYLDGLTKDAKASETIPASTARVDTLNLVAAWRRLVQARNTEEVRRTLPWFSRKLRDGGHHLDALAAVQEAVREYRGDQLETDLVAEECQLLRSPGATLTLRDRLGHLKTLLRSQPSHPGWVAYYSALGDVAIKLGRSRAGLRLNARGLAIARRIGDRALVTPLLVNPGVVLTLLGRFSEADIAIRHAIAAARADGDRRSHAVALIAYAVLLLDSGRPDEAIEPAGRAATIARAIENQRVEAVALVNLCAAYVASGETVSARSTAEHALRLFEKMRNDDGACFAHCVLAEADLADDKPLDACAHVENAITRASPESRGLLGYPLLIFGLVLKNASQMHEASQLLEFVSRLPSARPLDRARAAVALQGLGPFEAGPIRSPESWARRVLAAAAAMRLSAAASGKGRDRVTQVHPDGDLRAQQSGHSSSTPT